MQRWIRGRTVKDDINPNYGIYPEIGDNFVMEAVSKTEENKQHVAGGEETSGKQVSDYDKMYEDQAENRENNYDDMYN